MNFQLFLCFFFFFTCFTAAAASQYKTGRNGICRAYALTLPTTDTFRTVDILRYFHTHGANLLTSAAMVAAGSVYFHVIKAESLEQSIESTQGADIFAEGSANQYGRKNGQYQQNHFPVEQPANHLPQAFICQHQGNTAFQCPCRTNILAEVRRRNAKGIGKEYRQQYNRYSQHHIFQIPQSLIQLYRNFYLWTFDFIEQVLQKTEGTKEAADHSAQ